MNLDCSVCSSPRYFRAYRLEFWISCCFNFQRRRFWFLQILYSWLVMDCIKIIYPRYYQILIGLVFYGTCINLYQYSSLTWYVKKFELLLLGFYIQKHFSECGMVVVTAHSYFRIISSAKKSNETETLHGAIAIRPFISVIFKFS